MRGKRLVVALAVAAWLSEWIVGWSNHLGRVGDVISTVWLIAFGVLVVATLPKKLPRGLHTWGWMFALLVISGARAWWFGGTDLGLFAELSKQAPDVQQWFSDRDIAMIDAIANIWILGLAIGLAAAVDAMIFALTSWIGGLVYARREEPRVGLLPRICVFVLQAPAFVIEMGVGVAVFAGAMQIATHSELRTRAPALGELDLLATAGFGLIAWAIATLHLQCLFGLAKGRLPNRIALGVFAVAGAVGVAALSGHVQGIALAAVWLVTQLAALRWAKPRSATQ
jgi:hypothetical protein